MSKFPREGKTETAKAVGKLLRKKVGDTSDILYEIVARNLGVTVKYLRSLDKKVVRPYLIDAGNKECDKDPCALSKHLIAMGCSVICGIRRKAELAAILERLSVGHNVCTVIFVTRPGHPKKQDNGELSLEVVKEVVAGARLNLLNGHVILTARLYTVDNGGTIEDLTGTVKSLYQ